MPLYDRSFNDCEELFTVFCRIADKETPKECPKCGSTDGVYMLAAPTLSRHSERLMTHRSDKGFGEVIDRVKERNPRTPLATGRDMKTQLSDNL